MKLMSFKGSKHSFAKKIANELFNTMQNSVSEGAEMFASDIYNVAKFCSQKNIETVKLAILDGWDYYEVCQETKEQYDFWDLVGSYLNDIE